MSAAALGTPGTLRVGVNASSAPLAGQTSSSSNIVGIDVDVAAYLADQMGLKVEIIDVGNDPATALSEGKADMVLGVDASEEGSGYWKSNIYIQTGVVLFGTAAETAVPTTDSKPAIAAQASSKSSWRVTNLFGDSSLVVQDDLKAAFDAVEKGTARYVASDAVVGTYVAHSNGYDDKIVALLQDPSGYCAAVASTNTELQGAVATAVDKLVSGGMMNIVESKWLGKSLNLGDTTVVKAASDAKKKEDDKKSAEAQAAKAAESGGSADASQAGDSGTDQPVEGEVEQPAETETYAEPEGEGDQAADEGDQAVEYEEEGDQAVADEGEADGGEAADEGEAEAEAEGDQSEGEEA